MNADVNDLVTRRQGVTKAKATVPPQARKERSMSPRKIGLISFPPSLTTTKIDATST